MVRGQGLAKLMTEANSEANQIDQFDDNSIGAFCDMDSLDWYKDIIYR